MQPQRSADKRPSYAAAVHSPLAVVCASASSQAESSPNAEGDGHAPAAILGSPADHAPPRDVQRALRTAAWRTSSDHTMMLSSQENVRGPRASSSKEDSVGDWSLEDSADADLAHCADNGDKHAHSELLLAGECSRRPTKALDGSGPSEWAQLLQTLFVVGLPLVARQLGSLFSRQVLSRLFGRLRAP